MLKFIYLSILALTALSAQAREPASIRAAKADSYQTLQDVELSPAQQPRYRKGIDQLKNRELRYKERLPMQLAQSVKRVSKRKYSAN